MARATRRIVAGVTPRKTAMRVLNTLSCKVGRQSEAMPVHGMM